MNDYSKDINDLVKDYYINQKLSIKKISRLLNISNVNIILILKDQNITIKSSNSQITFDLENDIIPLYNQGFSLTRIAKQFNTSRDTLSAHLRKYGIKIINRQNLTKFDENVFDIINTEEKAYWLGFIYADGSLSSRDNNFELSLKGSDFEHLCKFNTFMKHHKDNVKMGFVSLNGKHFTRCRWSITNKHLWNTLNNYGCTPQKSLTLIFPDPQIFTNRCLIKHFIRGYFDGNGCISQTSSNAHHRTYMDDEMLSPVSKFTGPKAILEVIQSYIPIDNNDRKLEQNSNNNDIIYTLTYSQQKSRILFKYLYNDCTIYLNRKYKLAEFFKNNCRSFKELKELLVDNIGETPFEDNTEITLKIT